jgi:hypothetical protein
MPGTRDRIPLSTAASLALPLLFAAACAGGGAGSLRGPEPADGKPETLMGYDSQAQGSACEAPREACPDAKRDADFADRCRLAGYRLLRCGCEDACSGKVKKQEAFFDSAGKERSCAPEQAGCTPPETSAKFQDACTDARHKLVVCGCEWLCNGPLATGGAAASD